MAPPTYLVAGTYEPWFHDNARRWTEALQQIATRVLFEERPGEHGGSFWYDEFPHMITWLESVARRHRKTDADETGRMLLDALSAVEPTMSLAFRSVGQPPPVGSSLDQAGLADGGEIVADYIRHGEAGLALDHLLYMIVEPPLPLSKETFQLLQQTSERLGGVHDQLQNARSLVVEES